MMNASRTTIVQSAESKSVSEGVVHAVSEATGTEPTQLELLYDIVDPDALDHLFQTQSGHPESDHRIVFTMEGCEVTVHAGGKIVVSPPAAESTMHRQESRM